MNWIERLYEIKGKDLYSQNGEGLLLEYIWYQTRSSKPFTGEIIDIGSGDGFILSNSRHLELQGWRAHKYEKKRGYNITVENILIYTDWEIDILSIDIDGNDYWLIDKCLERETPSIIIAEFNPAFTDSRTIKYNPSHEWAGDDYYGFSFEAGKKLAEKHGYEIIFNVANMNLIMVRKDLINVSVPPVTYKQDNFFKASGRPDEDWKFI